MKIIRRFLLIARLSYYFTPYNRLTDYSLQVHKLTKSSTLLSFWPAGFILPPNHWKLTEIFFPIWTLWARCGLGCVPRQKTCHQLADPPPPFPLSDDVIYEQPLTTATNPCNICMILAVDSFDNWTSMDFLKLNEVLKWNSFLLLETFLEFKFNIMSKIHKGKLQTYRVKIKQEKVTRIFWQMTWDPNRDVFLVN